MTAKRISIIVFIAACALCFASCVSSTGPKGEVYSKFYEEEPVTILIMPPINNSGDVEAKDYFYSTLAMPIANAGFYTYPMFLTLETLQKENAYDSELFYDADLRKFNQLFGADLALFTIIYAWEKHHIGGSVDVSVEYIFRSTKTNQVVYRRRGDVSVDTSITSSSGGLIGLFVSMAATAISTAATSHISIARECNDYTIANDIPKGKYSDKFGLDKEEAAYGIGAATAEKKK